MVWVQSSAWQECQDDCCGTYNEVEPNIKAGEFIVEDPKVHGVKEGHHRHNDVDTTNDTHGASGDFIRWSAKANIEQDDGQDCAGNVHWQIDVHQAKEVFPFNKEPDHRE